MHMEKCYNKMLMWGFYSRNLFDARFAEEMFSAGSADTI